MATTYNHAQIGIVDAAGNVNVIYPITTGADVSITRTNTKLPTTATTAQKLADSLGKLAFLDSQINDSATSTTSTWSSNLINTKLTELNSKASKIKTYVGTDGLLHFTDSAGADAVLPFSNKTGTILLQGVYSNGTGTDSETSVIFNVTNSYNTELLSYSNGIYTCNTKCIITFVLSSSGCYSLANYTYTDYIHLYINNTKVASAYGNSSQMGPSVLYTKELAQNNTFKFTRSGYSWARDGEYQHAVVTAFVSNS